MQGVARKEEKCRVAGDMTEERRIVRYKDERR